MAFLPGLGTHLWMAGLEHSPAPGLFSESWDGTKAGWALPVSCPGHAWLVAWWREFARTLWLWKLPDADQSRCVEGNLLGAPRHTPCSPPSTGALASTSSKGAPPRNSL